MRNPPVIYVLRIFALEFAIFTIGVTVAAAAPKELPSFEQVWQATEKQLAKLPNYEPGDLISCQQVAPVFPILKALGWPVLDRDEILKLVPMENEYFVTKLRTKAGRKFMRQIERYPLAFDRIDRIGRMYMGDDNVDALIRGPDGYKMLQYMTETAWGKTMGKMLSQAPRGKDFNAPTGRLYTADALMLRLQQSYEAELERRGLKQKSKK
ncbi:MAG: hypothetical protein IT427_15765 [Pirellulales bacterium]|nr:hypothetical protein [Pirellulales bacterium]